MRHELIGYASARAPAKFADPFHSSRSARACRELIKARARRSTFFKASLFSDPAWDILLELFAADCEGRKLSISSVGLSANIAMTTALRWIDVLERDGLVQRQDDPLDGRRRFLTLSCKGFQAMRAYVEADEQAF
jgi:DNA-binding MarR family transcriptional regulator